MYAQDRESRRSDDDKTRVNIGVVFGFTLEAWPDLRKAIEAMGGTIRYYKLAPPGIFLKVTEEPLPAHGRGPDAAATPG